MPERKTDYEKEEKLVNALDNCDDSVFHIDHCNETLMVDCDNVGYNRFTINILSNFTSPFNYRTFSPDSNLKKMCSRLSMVILQC